MPDVTKNYGLTKPLPEEFYDVNVQNDNMDIIDQELKKKYDPDNKPTPEDVGAAPKTHYHDDRYYTQSQIDEKVSGLSNNKHTHDDRYYTEAEVNSLMEGKASTNHGNHVPTTQTADSATFLRNDNTWQKVTPANIGASATGHNHDDRYYTEAEIDAKLQELPVTGHKHSAEDITSGELTTDRIPVIPISKGGTGSTSATAALTNLGAAKSVHKHGATDITSGTLSSDRLPVIPITKGGTGASNAETARTNLGVPAISHEQGADTITAGTFAGQVKAKGSAQNPDNLLLRNSALSSIDATPAYNGEICWMYE